ncbi:HEPN domain-containing protein [Streptomyces poriferorum]|uniref:HEPN domain-containing protein n=1 Tax=Streptomyces poriferorum TaxID=2798799 RepID=A0ABY9IHJ6_9ACTN|nr:MULTISPECIES: HEPN domain-containing protein [unclassified Streptomyces]MDP5315578.1 HEPN domain-containing protein [Streptomyces sp. Alt4]WLQ53954.1 HEPN domain-containing protein [Streptomyces sp. Alt2]
MKHLPLREAALSWLEHAAHLPTAFHGLTDEALTELPEWEALEEAVSTAAPRNEHPDLYARVNGDRIPNYRILLGESGLGAATRLIAQGRDVPKAEAADRFVAFCAHPAPVPERWLLLNGDFPRGTQIRLGPYTLQTFTEDDLRQMVPMPAVHDLRPGGLDFGLIAGAPFLHVPEPDRTVTRHLTWFDFTGPRAEAQHWQALLPLMLWDDELLRVDSVFTVQRGRRFDLHPTAVPTTLHIYQDHQGRENEDEIRETGTFHVPPASLEALTAFCTEISAKIDAVMAGVTHKRNIVNRRARRLERAARHLLAAYQRTYYDNGVWPVETDELLLDYVITLEALLISPVDKDHENIGKNIRSRAAALFLTPAEQERTEALVKRAYGDRSTYVHGGVIKAQSEEKKLEALRTLRLLTLQIFLRWLILTPSDTKDLTTLLDVAEGPDHTRAIEQPLRDFFTATPPRARPADIA